MSEATDTFHLNFDTKTYPGKVLAVQVQIKRIIVGKDDKTVFRLDLCDHSAYPALCRYVRDNPASQIES